ncbi:MAG: hypothetical protein HYV63_07075 [Candidatus Schekmanbacteria bacterium]|nr:hypothetical protein [Candidatus Schekmanbacteria bacterium]
MDFESIMMFIVAIGLAAAAGYFLFRIAKYGGLGAALFGAPIEATVGEVAGTKAGYVTTVLKVNRLGGGSAEKAVGLEIVTKSFGSYQMFPITLSAAETRKLIALLQTATNAR